MTENIAKDGYLAQKQDDLAKKLRRLSLFVSSISLLLGVIGMVINVKFGLFGAASLLGWTQLVGY